MIGGAVNATVLKIPIKTKKSRRSHLSTRTLQLKYHKPHAAHRADLTRAFLLPAPSTLNIIVKGGGGFSTDVTLPCCAVVSVR
jgi:hypothetical protein